MSRKIVGLRWAEKASSPWVKSKARKGTKGEGQRFQKLIAKALPKAEHEPWFQFADANGTGYCSPDLLLWLSPHELLVLECKRTYWPGEPESQIKDLYFPVLRKIYPFARVRGVIVVKNLSHKAKGPAVVETLVEALLAPQIPILFLPFPRLGHPSLSLSPEPFSRLAPLSASDLLSV